MKKKPKPKLDEVQAAVRAGNKIIAKYEQPLVADSEAAWKEWSAAIAGVDARGMALLRAAFDTGVKVGRLESKKTHK